LDVKKHDSSSLLSMVIPGTPNNEFPKDTVDGRILPDGAGFLPSTEWE